MQPILEYRRRMMNAEIVAAVVAGAVSVACEVIPGLSDLWNGVGKKWKPAIVLGLSLAVPVAAIGVRCLGIDLGLGAACPDPASAQMWVDALRLGLVAFLASQAAFQLVGAPLGERVHATG